MAPKNSNEPLESAITAKILKALRAKGGYWVKTHGSPFTANQPDVIGVYLGRYVALEVKRPSRQDSVTPGQRAILDAISANEGFAAVVCSVADALDVLAQVEEEGRDAGLWTI